MRNAKNLMILAGALGASILAASAATAQTAAPGPHPEQRAKWAEHMKAEMAAHRAEHIKVLHDALSIRPEQEAAFKTFADSMTPKHEGWKPGEKGAKKPHEAWTTAKFIEHAEKRLAEKQTKLGALKAFYAQLSPSQQQTFDALHKLQHHGGWRGHEHRGWGGGERGEHGPMGPMGGHHPDGPGAMGAMGDDE